MRMRMRTRIACVLCIVHVTATGSLFAAGQTDEAAAGSDRLADIGFHAAGYPIVDQQVTMDTMVMRAGHFPVDFKDMTMVQDIQEMTNVKIEFTEIPQAQCQEKVNLMYASLDFPDAFWNVAGNSDQNVFDGAKGGKIWPLNDYLEQYAPNWMKAFKEYPILKKTITFPDGNIYTLPYSRQIPSDYGIRDIEAINTDWLEKVGMAMPSTTDELFDVLKAFRNGIDDGTLPKDGIPYYLRFHSTIGGEMPVYGYFGLYIYDASYLSVSLSGEVEFAATNPEVIDVLEYLNKLYEEGIIIEEAFTDSWNEYLTKIRSDPPITGLWGSYHLPDNLAPYYDALPPVAAPGVDKPLFRSQQVRIEKNKFTVFTGFEYPEVAVRFMDIWADDEYAAQLSYGPIGLTMRDNGDGTFTAGGTSAEYLSAIPHNFTASYISKSVSDNIIFEGQSGRRARFVNEVYSPYTWAQERHYPRVQFTEQELEDRAVLSNEISTFVKSTWANWVVNGGARDGWDSYVEQLKKLNLKEYMDINQAAYDRFAGN